MRVWLVIALGVCVAGCNKSSASATSTNTVNDASLLRPIVDIIKAGDPSVCANTDVQRDVLLGMLKSNGWGDVAQLFEAHQGTLPPFDAMSMTARNAAINEVTCSGNAVLGSGTDSITYKLRPSADGTSYVWQLVDGDQALLYAAGSAVLNWNHAHGLYTASEQQQQAQDNADKARLQQQQDRANAAAASANSAVPEVNRAALDPNLNEAM